MVTRPVVRSAVSTSKVPDSLRCNRHCVCVTRNWKRVVVVGSFVGLVRLGALAAPAVFAWAAEHSAANEGGEQDKKED